MRTILAPVDFSHASQSVAREAGRYGRLTGARVVLLHVIPPPLLVASYGVPPLVDAEIEERWRAAEKTMLQLEQITRAAGAQHVAGRVVKGSVVQTILDEAAGASVELIVMGSHGHGAVYDLLLGSTSSGVLKRATCPVLILPIRTTDKH